MGRREQQPRKTVEVQVVFEVSHLATDCLADVYERLVPILRRSLSPAPTPQQVGHPNPNRSLNRRQS